MAYKDILVYLDPTDAAQDRLRLAVAMALAHGARLIGGDVDFRTRPALACSSTAGGDVVGHRTTRRRSRRRAWPFPGHRQARRLDRRLEVQADATRLVDPHANARGVRN